MTAFLDKQVIYRTLKIYKSYYFHYMWKKSARLKTLFVILAFLLLDTIGFIVTLPYPLLFHVFDSYFLLILIIVCNAIVSWLYGEQTRVARFKTSTDEEITKILRSSIFIQICLSLLFETLLLSITIITTWVQDRMILQLTTIGILWYLLRIVLGIIFLTLITQWAVFAQGNFLKHSVQDLNLSAEFDSSPLKKAKITFIKTKNFWSDTIVYKYFIGVYAIWGYILVIATLFTNVEELRGYFSLLTIPYLIPPILLGRHIALGEPLFDILFLILIVFVWRKLPTAMKNIRPEHYTLPADLLVPETVHLLDNDVKMPLATCKPEQLKKPEFSFQEYSLRNTCRVLKTFYRRQAFKSYIDSSIVWDLGIIFFMLLLLYPLVILFNIVAVPLAVNGLLFLNIAITWIYGEKSNISRFKALPDHEIRHILSSSLKANLLIIIIFEFIGIGLGMVTEWYAFRVPLELTSTGIFFFFLRMILTTLFFLVFIHWLIFAHGNFLRYEIILKADVAKFRPPTNIRKFYHLKKPLLDRTGRIFYGIVSVAMAGYVCVLGIVFGISYLPLKSFTPIFILYLFPQYLFGNNEVLGQLFYDFLVTGAIIVFWKRLILAIKQIPITHYTVPEELISSISFE